MESPGLAAKAEHNWRLHDDPDMERRLAYIGSQIQRNTNEWIDLAALFQKTQGQIENILGRGYLGDK